MPTAGRSSNGRTGDFESLNLGPIPSLPAVRRRLQVYWTIFKRKNRVRNEQTIDDGFKIVSDSEYKNMKENRLTIKIKKPISEVFNFTITPSNTPVWIDTIVNEQIGSDLIRVGTRYTNQDKEGNINVYEVSQFKDDQIFELKSIPPLYTVRYTYTPISDTETELEYFEWVWGGELKNPFAQANLEKLKNILEARN